MRRTRLIALAALAATAVTQLASGAAPGSKQTCRGLSVTITENRKGDPIGPGKDATVATLDAAMLERPLTRRWLERVRRSSAPFPSDAPPDALERIAALPQFQA